MTWESLYQFLHIKDFIYFISSPAIQDMLFPVKLIFIFCSVFFLFFIVYFLINSSWLQYKFLEDVTDFFFWKAAGQREISKQWVKIRKRIESGNESDFKLAIIDADDFLAAILDQRGYEGENFDVAVKKAGKLISAILDDVLKAHETRNSIVHNPNFKLSAIEAKKILDTYEIASKNVGLG